MPNCVQIMELLILAGLFALLYFWWANTQSRETAIKLARAACARCGVQLLDETVTLQKLRPRRTAKGHMGIARWYTFEFSASGNDRKRGIVGLLGTQLLQMHLEVDVEELSS